MTRTRSPDSNCPNPLWLVIGISSNSSGETAAATERACLTGACVRSLEGSGQRPAFEQRSPRSRYISEIDSACAIRQPLGLLMAQPGVVGHQGTYFSESFAGIAGASDTRRRGGHPSIICIKAELSPQSESATSGILSPRPNVFSGALIRVNRR
jgi:hypothetical protein